MFRTDISCLAGLRFRVYVISFEILCITMEKKESYAIFTSVKFGYGDVGRQGNFEGKLSTWK